MKKEDAFYVRDKFGVKSNDPVVAQLWPRDGGDPVAEDTLGDVTVRFPGRRGPKIFAKGFETEIEGRISQTYQTSGFETVEKIKDYAARLEQMCADQGLNVEHKIFKSKKSGEFFIIFTISRAL